MNPTTETDCGQLRPQFEEWVSRTQGWKSCKQRGKPMSLRKHMDGSYADYRVNDRWLAWKAAVKVLST